jgi:hypothetical protein
MGDAEIRARVQALRAKGCTPKVIVRTLGRRPADVADLIRELATQARADSPEREPELVGCWVSPGWSNGLTFDQRPDWPDVDRPDESTSGLASVLVVRRESRDRVSVCGYLVDTGCLGVKNAIGPKGMGDLKLRDFGRAYFRAYDDPPLAAPLDLAQHLVYGAEQYARGLGFEPHPDFAPAKRHLGQWSGPSAIQFGRDGKPFYFEGPYDNSSAILRTLDRTVGRGKYHYVVASNAPSLR